MNGQTARRVFGRLTPFVLALFASVAAAPAPAVTPEEEPAASAGWTMEANGIRVEVTASPATFVVGDSVTLVVDVLAPAGVTIGMPEIEEMLGEFTVLEREERPDVPDGAGRRWRSTYELATFAAGATEIPALEIALGQDAAGEDRTITTAPIALDVSSVLAERDTELLDVADPVRINVLAWGMLLAFAIAGLVLLGAGAWAFFFIRSRRPLPPAAPPLPAHVQALRALDALEAEHLPADGRVHEFFVRVSDIARRYVEDRFGLRAVEQTTAEFLQAARRDARLSAEHRAGLEGFLRAADMVKFAQHRPAPAECDDALAAARGFVETTADRGEAVAA